MICTLCGMRKSGKSSFAREKYSDSSYFIVDVHEIRANVRFSNFSDSMFYSYIYSLIQEKLEQGYSIIYDDDNITRSRRAKIIKHFPNEEHTAIYFDTPAFTCKSRASAEERHVIAKQELAIRPPRVKEGFVLICKKNIFDKDMSPWEVLQPTHI